MIRPHHIRAAVLLFLFVSSVESQSVEYTVKASFIEKFARFTEWESGDIGDSFIVGILGKSPFNGELERLASKVKIKNKPVRINYIREYRDAHDCQLLFICRSERENIRDIVRSLKGTNVLMVSDSPGFSELGVHFNFYLKENETIHFEVNPKALSRTKLKTDMLLLSIGKVIN